MFTDMKESNCKKLTDKKHQGRVSGKKVTVDFHYMLTPLLCETLHCVLHDMLFQRFTLILEYIFQWYILNSNCTYMLVGYVDLFFIRLSFIYNAIKMCFPPAFCQMAEPVDIGFIQISFMFMIIKCGFQMWLL